MSVNAVDGLPTASQVTLTNKGNPVGIKEEEEEVLPTLGHHDRQPNGQQSKRSAWFSIVSASCGLISDGYQNSVMSNANVAFKKLYPKQYTSAMSTRVSNAILVGIVLGAIFFGLTCDLWGRRSSFVATTALMVCGMIICTAAGGVSVDGMLWCIIVGRGIVGFGVGGEYSASALNCLESTEERMNRHRGPIFAVATNGVWGGVIASIIYIIALAAGGDENLGSVWRACFGVGLVFPVAMFALRLGMDTSLLWRQARITRRVPLRSIARKYWFRLAGISGAFFIYDFINFPNSIFSATIIASVAKNGTLLHTAEWNLFLGALPLLGVFACGLVLNKLGRRTVLCLGFGGAMIFNIIIGAAYNQLAAIPPLFIVLYAISQSLGHFGPGSVIGLVSAEAFPTGIRGTMYGLCAAIGKAGAAVGTEAFTPIQTHAGKRWTFIVAGILGSLGVLLSWFCIPETGSIEHLRELDEEFEKQLHEDGWEGHLGEVDEDEKEYA